MKRNLKSSAAAAVLSALLSTAVFAQEAEETAPDQMPHDQEAGSGGMMRGGMMGGDMQGMMSMMEKMGPMMEACTEMMQAKIESGAEMPSSEQEG